MKLSNKLSAKFSKHVNGEEMFFHKWIISDLTYNHFNKDHTIYNNLMENLDDAQLERSGFVFQ